MQLIGSKTSHHGKCFTLCPVKSTCCECSVIPQTTYMLFVESHFNESFKKSCLSNHCVDIKTNYVVGAVSSVFVYFTGPGSLPSHRSEQGSEGVPFDHQELV